MEPISSLIKRARECHTKLAWEGFFREHRKELRGTTSAKVLAELFRLLHSDPQSLQYDPDIWSSLLEACLSSWNLELGSEIAEHIRTVPSTKTAIPAAKLYAEKGQPLLARNIANRALRLSGLSSLERLQLEMIACQSYVDEGKRNMAIKLSNRMQQTLQDDELEDAEKAQFLGQLARTNFFLGRYPLAGKLFYESFSIFNKLGNWYEAARSVYNAGSAYFSAGGKLQESAFALIEECRRISELHNLQGPLSHVEAFYGHDDYWHGDFAGARDHYRRAHKYIPTSDKSFRTLHVLSMLTFIYLRTGQYLLAQKFGKKTLDLAEKDQSQRFRSRYHNLRAEIMWESGNVEESQKFLAEHVGNIILRGANTLEELSTLSRYYYQCAKLGEDPVTQKVKISEQLKKNTGDWVEFLHASAKLHLGARRYALADEAFRDCLTKAKHYGDKYHTGLSYLGLIQIALATNKALGDIEALAKDFEIAMARLTETPIKVHIHFIRAAIAYRRGDFEAVKTHLMAASHCQRINYCDKFVIEAWLSTINGYASRVNAQWQRSLVSSLTRVYFAPTLKPMGQGRYLVTDHFEVNLTQHPALNDLLEYLLQRNRFQATPAEIQTEVWKQSLKQQGWRQKIRNAITRMRDLVPYTLAPLIIHDEHVALNAEAIVIVGMTREDATPKDEILRLLREGPMSTVHLSNRLHVSSATTKRLLKRLSDEEQITVMKVGRQVYYQALKHDANDGERH